MSKFNGYAQRLNDIAVTAFHDFNETRRELDEAKHAKDTTSPYDTIAMARANVRVDEAEKAFANAQANLKDGVKKIAKVREDMKEAIEEEFVLKPSCVDSNAIELLKTGTMSIKDYEWLLQKALSEENHTMTKIIGHYAEQDARYSAESKSGDAIRSISYRARQDDGREFYEVFDTLCGVYERTANNPKMMEVWSALTGELIEEF